jgi:HAD superfamily hydrolase (TIGR01509 family)
MAQVAQLTGKTMTEIEHIVSADHIRNESLVGIVQSLRADFKVGLLSNVGRDLIARLFSEEEVSTLFDAVVLSSEVGMVKPYPEIFELMADRLGVRPDDCLMIDDMPDNIAGAESVGMQGIVFRTNDELESALKRSVGSSNLK